MNRTEPILVSACLLGEPCRYDGKSKPCEAVQKLAARYLLIPVCPECLGGLPIPRVPSEIVGDRVMSRDGRDLTDRYRSGAEKTLGIAREKGCRVAVLKEKSPSCGKGSIHNGKFDGGLVPGNGVTAALLEANGVRVVGEHETEKIPQILEELSCDC